MFIMPNLFVKQNKKIDQEEFYEFDVDGDIMSLSFDYEFFKPSDESIYQKPFIYLNSTHSLINIKKLK